MQEQEWEITEPMDLYHKIIKLKCFKKEGGKEARKEEKKNGRKEEIQQKTCLRSENQSHHCKPVEAAGMKLELRSPLVTSENQYEKYRYMLMYFHVRAEGENVHWSRVFLNACD